MSFEGRLLKPADKVTISHFIKEDEMAAFGTTLRATRFNNLLLEAVDQALGELLGRRCVEQIYDHLAVRYGYGREDIPQNISYFYEFLESVLSPTATKAVGRMIVRRLCSKLDCDLETQALEFVECIEVIAKLAERNLTAQDRAERTFLEISR